MQNSKYTALTRMSEIQVRTGRATLETKVVRLLEAARFTTQKSTFPKSEIWRLFKNRKTWLDLDTGLREKAGQQEMRGWPPTRGSGSHSRVSGRQCVKMQEEACLGDPRELCI